MQMWQDCKEDLAWNHTSRHLRWLPMVETEHLKEICRMDDTSETSTHCSIPSFLALIYYPSLASQRLASLWQWETRWTFNFLRKRSPRRFPFMEAPQNTQPPGPSRIAWTADVIMTNWCRFDLQGPKLDLGWGKPFYGTAGGGTTYPPWIHPTDAREEFRRCLCHHVCGTWRCNRGENWLIVERVCGTDGPSLRLWIKTIPRSIAFLNRMLPLYRKCVPSGIWSLVMF